MTTTHPADNSVDPRSRNGTNNVRRAIHAYCSTDAHDEWHGFADEHGVSVSAILEALPRLGLLSLDEQPELAGRKVGPVMADVVKVARSIDGARRRRRAR